MSARPSRRAARRVDGRRRLLLHAGSVALGDTTTFVEVDAIDWIAAAENYVELHVGSVQHLVHVALTTLERSLDPARFLRVHRGAIVASMSV